MISGETLKKQWKNLRDSYAKHLRSEKTHTGQQAKRINRYKTWPWAQQMEFLKPYLEFARTESNVSATVGERDGCEGNSNINTSICETPTEDGESVQQREEHTQEQCVQEGVSQPRPPVFKKTRKQIHSQESSKPSSVDKVLEYLRSRNVDPCSSLDDMDLIFLGYSKALKKLSPRRQTIAKFKIAEVIMKEELGQQMEDSINATPSLHSDITSPGTNISVASASSAAYSEQCSAPLTPLEPFNAEASCASWYRGFAPNE